MRKQDKQEKEMIKKFEEMIDRCAFHVDSTIEQSWISKEDLKRKLKEFEKNEKTTEGN